MAGKVWCGGGDLRSQISNLITIIEDRLKLAGAAEYTIEIIAWTL